MILFMFIDKLFNSKAKRCISLSLDYLSKSSFVHVELNDNLMEVYTSYLPFSS